MISAMPEQRWAWITLSRNEGATPPGREVPDGLSKTLS